MKKAALSFIAVAFVLWILPLGIFIKPSQEKVACGGQRAVCLCSHRGEAAVSAKPMEAGTTYKSAASTQKEVVPSAGAGHYYVTASVTPISMMVLAAQGAKEYPAYKTPYLDSLEHVPKA